MNTTLPQDPRFKKQYRQHLQCLKLGGLQPKTIDAYARAIRRIGNYFDCRNDNLNSGQLRDYFTELTATSPGQVPDYTGTGFLRPKNAEN